jgi:hypothetical protein
MPSSQVKEWVRGNDFFTSAFGGSRVEQKGDVFVPNLKTPHIHISNNFVVLKKSVTNHIDLIRGSEVFNGRCQDALSYSASHSADMEQVCRYILSQLAD